MSQRVAPPNIEPVTEAQVRANSQIPHAEDDTFLADQVIPAARGHVESMGRFALITSTWLEAFACFGELRPDRSPLRSVEAIRYIDTAGAQLTLDPSVYHVNTVKRPGIISLAPGQTWPALGAVPFPIEVEFKAGFGDARADVPEVLRRAVTMLASYWYEQREAFIAGTVDRAIGLSLESMVQQAGGQVRYR